MTSTTDIDQHVLDFLEDDELDEFDFIPEIECNSANNGIVKIKILNIENLWEHNVYDEACLPAFKICCKSSCNHQDEDDDIDWTEINIFVGNIADDGTFYLLLNANLESYDFVFFLQANDTKTNQWLSPSQQQIVRIPSFVIDINYQINEWVDFRKYNDYQPIQAQIIEILENDMFKLKYDEYDSSSNDNRKWIQKTSVVHLSRLYKQSIDNQYITRISSPHRMENDLLIRRNDEESKLIWTAIIEYTKLESIYCCQQMYDEDTILIHYQSMSYFVAKNIFEFLFKPQFEFKTNCFINNNDGVLSLKNVRQNYIGLSYERFKTQQPNKEDVDDVDGDIDLDFSVLNDIKYACDWCWVDMSEWDYYYSCNVDVTDKHDICLNCVSRVIRLNAELKYQLKCILEKQLIIDCIHNIADYVIGGVKSIDLRNKTDIEETEKKEFHHIMSFMKRSLKHIEKTKRKERRRKWKKHRLWNNKKRNKRKIKHCFVPFAKRRKLN